MSLVTAGAAFPGRREDFDSDDSYTNWRKHELDSLQMHILHVVTVDKSSLRDTSADRPAPTSRPSSVVFTPSTPQNHGRQSPAPHGRSPSLSSSVGGRTPAGHFTPHEFGSPSPGTHTVQDEHAHSSDDTNFTYIPSRPREAYRYLLQLCLTADLERLKHLDPDEHVSLRILSQTHSDFLQECSKWWRLTERICSTLFLQEVGARFAEDEIPLVQCVTEAMRDVNLLGQPSEDASNPLGWDGWSMAERITLTDSLSELFDTLLRRHYECIQAAKSTDADYVQLLREILDLVYQNPVFREATAHDLPDRFKELAEAVRIVAAHQYDKQRTLLGLNDWLSNLEEVDHVDLVVRLQELLGWIRQGVRAVDKLFNQPILE